MNVVTSSERLCGRLQRPDIEKVATFLDEKPHTYIGDAGAALELQGVVQPCEGGLTI